MKSAAVIAPILAMLLTAGGAVAGDPSGVDPAIIDRCVAAATSEGARADCAGTGVAACKSLWAGRKPDLDAVTILEGCTDAEQQLWDQRLEDEYKALIARTGVDRPEEVATVRAMERAWIAFRDARCAAERGLFGHGTGGAMAEPECRLKETARQAALLSALARGD